MGKFTLGNRELVFTKNNCIVFKRTLSYTQVSEIFEGFQTALFKTTGNKKEKKGENDSRKESVRRMLITLCFSQTDTEEFTRILIFDS